MRIRICSFVMIIVLAVIAIPGLVQGREISAQDYAYEIVVVFSDFTAHLFTPDGTELFTAMVALPRHMPKLPVEGVVVSIERNPWWFPPPGVKTYVLKHEGIKLPNAIPPGLNNPMGPVKFSFKFFTPGTQYWLSKLHGTNHPESIGKHATSGCIRLYNEEATKLADIVEPLFNAGATITIRYVKTIEHKK